jgi:hypothetical protein
MCPYYYVHNVYIIIIVVIIMIVASSLHHVIISLLIAHCSTYTYIHMQHVQFDMHTTYRIHAVCVNAIDLLLNTVHCGSGAQIRTARRGWRCVLYSPAHYNCTLIIITQLLSLWFAIILCVWHSRSYYHPHHYCHCCCIKRSLLLS